MKLPVLDWNADAADAIHLILPDTLYFEALYKLHFKYISGFAPTYFNVYSVQVSTIKTFFGYNKAENVLETFALFNFDCKNNAIADFNLESFTKTFNGYF